MKKQRAIVRHVVIMLLPVLVYIARPVEAAEFKISDVASHVTSTDCWMAIEGKIYDVTSYIKDHPEPKQAVVVACGTDATKAWQTKGNLSTEAKPHTRKAAVLLKKYFLGDLVNEP